MKGFTTDGPSSSRETPMTTRPSLPYCFCSSMKPGISSRQGGHHVAQKSRTTTLPLKSDSLTALPSTSLSSQAGATLGSSVAQAGGAPGVNKYSAAVTPTASASRLRRLIFKFIVSIGRRWSGFIPSPAGGAGGKLSQGVPVFNQVVEVAAAVHGG